MGRAKRVIEKIKDRRSRELPLLRRHGGQFKKAKELSVLCDAQVGLIIISCAGKMYEFSSEPLRMEQIIERYQSVQENKNFTSNAGLQYPAAHHVSRSVLEMEREVVELEEGDNPWQPYDEMTKLKSNTHDIQPSLWPDNKNDLSSMQYEELDELEQQLECSIKMVRDQKDQLLKQKLKDLQRKERTLKKENGHLSRRIQEQQQEQSDFVLQLSNPASSRVPSFQANQQDYSFHHPNED